jgi:hypothetical protein
MRHDDLSPRDCGPARGPSRKRRLQFENLEERTLLSNYTVSELYHLGIPTVRETVNGATTDYYNPASPFVFNTGSGSNTVNILDTSAGIAIKETGYGNDTVNLGSGSSVQGILAPVTLQNPPSYNTIDVDDSADATARVVALSTYSSSGYNWGLITGLAPAAINYKYYDTSSLTIATGSGAGTVNVNATGVPTNIKDGGADDLILGSFDGVKEIVGTLTLQNPPSHNTIFVDDSADATARVVALSTYSSSGYNWGSITGLAPAAINYKYDDTSSVVNIWTSTGRVTWNVSANAMTSASGVEVDDNGFAINSVPILTPGAATSYSPAPAGAPLFHSGGPSYLDVVQGGAADCWLMASLAEVAARAPQDIVNMFTYDGTIVDNGSTVGLYTVRFFDPAGNPLSVQVDTELPAGGQTYAHVSNALGTQALWVALAEKAYAVQNALGRVNTNHEFWNNYGALDYGDAAWALQAITGHSAIDMGLFTTGIYTSIAAGGLEVICTPSSSPLIPFLVGNHCYAVVCVNGSSNNPFQVFNPWGTDSSGWAPGHANQIWGLFWTNALVLQLCFVEQAFGTGAGLWSEVTEPVKAPSGSASSVDGYGTSGTISSTSDSLDGKVTGTAVAAFHDHGGTATGYYRPTQWTAIGFDERDEATPTGLRARRHTGW